ncbi:MAG: DUF4838 domain-containing protein [Bacteroidota bacterium]
MNIKLPKLLILMLLLGFQSLAETSENHPKLLIASNGSTKYSIRLFKEPKPVELQSAKLLQDYLFKSTQVEFKIKGNDSLNGKTSIYLMTEGHSDFFTYPIPWKKINPDGFIIAIAGQNILIAGGSDKGLLCGISHFLEKYLGIRKFSDKAELLPHWPVLSIEPVNELQNPAFEYRSNHIKDPAYDEWHGLDNYNDTWGMYVHTFNKLIPPQEYFSTHPEYFSLLPAGRVPDAQLCLSNPAVLKLVIERLGERIKLEPSKKYWSVSQNDTYSPCGCENCKKLDLKYGGPSGTMIWFVNQVAAAFPDRQVSTLAYQYTRSAPRNIKPRENVNIFLCSIECDRSKALTEHPGGQSFVKDVEEWSKLTHNIMIWDYIIQYRSMMSPFPNFPVLQPNLQFFAKMKIPMVFEQGPSIMGHSEFSELRAYLAAKLLWNPDVKIDSVMNDFCTGYYGKAGPMILDYIGTMNHELKSSGEELGIYGLPKPSDNGYLSQPNIKAYAVIFDQAENAVKDDKIFLERVRAARLPLQFATLEIAKILGVQPGGFFTKDEKGSFNLRKDLLVMLDTFLVRCKRNDIKGLNEKGNAPDEFYKNTLAFLNTSYQPNLAYLAPVSLDPPASPKYNKGNAQALTDGLCGLDDYSLNWLGWEGENMNAVIDLGKLMEMSSITLNFLQDNNAWIFMPLSVTFSISEDGKKYKDCGTKKTMTDAKAVGFLTEEIKTTISTTKARYIRVTAVNQKTCPVWHKGAGGKCWIFGDEIRVN